MDHRDLVERLATAWKAHDIEATLAYCCDDVVYELHGEDEHGVSTGVKTAGKPALRQLMQHMLTEWDYLVYDPKVLGVTVGFPDVAAPASGARGPALGESDAPTIDSPILARVQTRYSLRHRPSGETLSGTKRVALRIEDRIVRRIDEYQDRALVLTFMRLVGASVPPAGP